MQRVPACYGMKPVRTCRSTSDWVNSKLCSSRPSSAVLKGQTNSCWSTLPSRGTLTCCTGGWRRHGAGLLLKPRCDGMRKENWRTSGRWSKGGSATSKDTWMEQRQERLAQVAEQGNHHSSTTAVTPATASTQTTRCPRHLWVRLPAPTSS